MRPDDQPPQSSTTHPTVAIFGAEVDTGSRTLIDIARTALTRHPDAVAIDCNGDQLAYGEFSKVLEEQIDRLRRHGIGRGDRVGIRIPPGSMQLYVAVLAVVFSGAAYVPVDWGEDEERAQAIWEAAQVTVVYGADLQLSVVRPKTGISDASLPEPDDDAWILFSGATDALEGVATTHRSAVVVANAQAQAYLHKAPLGSGDRIMTSESITTLPAAKEMWLSWHKGATLVPVPCEVVNSPHALFTWIIEQEITVVAAAPSVAVAWPRHTLDKVRLLILISQNTSPDLLERLRRPSLEIWTGYRDTLTVLRLHDEIDLSIPQSNMGGPIPGMQLAVVDPTGKPVRWGDVGEVVVAGLGLGRYLDSATDAEIYRPLPSLGWERAVHTGTLVRAERDGLIPAGPNEKPTRKRTPWLKWCWWPTR